MSYVLNFAEYLKKYPFHFLMGAVNQAWVTWDPFNWVTATGQSWNTQGSRHFAWLKCMVSAVQSLHSTFLSFVVSIKYRMHLSGQVIYLEHYLNDLFDLTERRIYIADGTPQAAPFLFNKAENNPIYIYNKSEDEDPFYLYNKDEYSSQDDFIVNVPDAIPLTPDLLNIIRAAVNKYRQAGSRYSIVNF